jgi:dTMP kinase
VIEGLDGAGKRTLAEGLTKALDARGVSVARRAFPRYGADVHADLVAAALRGEAGGLGDEVYGMGVLYALDRYGARDGLLADLAGYDIVLLDRYVASNAAYGAARLREGAGGAFARWVRELEIGRFELPVPDLQLLLRVPVAVAAERAAHRERTETNRERDKFEADAGLQSWCAVVYDELAATNWLGPWQVLTGQESGDQLADVVLAAR